MKTIPVKKFSVNMPTPTGTKSHDVTTKDLIKQSLELQPQQGFTVTEMKSRFRVLDALEEVNEESTVLQLEDADFSTLSAAVKNMKWGVLDKNILAFAEQFD